MNYNSTIRTKTGICPMCSDTNKKPLIKGLCQRHYWDSNKMKSAQKAQERELELDEDLQTLVADLDIVFSRYIRLKEADIFGRVACYCCGKKDKWTMMDAGHFIPRAHMYTRFSETNVKPCCQSCNRSQHGNLVAFAKALELERPGTVDELYEQAKIVYKYTRDELKGMIAEYSRKLKQVQKAA
jgi:5-methylcytosine-specific restriction endonuclease McrA